MKDNPMYVVCFFWYGERMIKPGTKPREATGDPSFLRLLQRAGSIDYAMASKYVNNLYRGVAKHATEPFKFVCFTNEPLTVDTEVEIRNFPIMTGKGVIPRMYMFSKEAGMHGHQVLSLDIDVVITGPLTDIMGYKGEFCTRRTFAPGEGLQIDGDIMSFQAGEDNEERFWKPFIKDLPKALEISNGGRERYWVRHVATDIADIWQDFLPGQVLSYKRHVRSRQRVPSGARIVSCHGHPRPHQLSHESPFLYNRWDLETKQAEK